MNARYTLIMALVAVALGIFAYTQRDAEPTDFTDGGPTPTPAPLYELEADDIQELKVVVSSEDEEGGGETTITRVAGGWEIDQQALADYVGGTIERLASPAVLRQLPEDRDPETYGFGSPTMTVTLSTAGGDSQVLVVGDEVPTDPQYYVRLGGEGRIVIISSSDLNSFKGWVTDPPYAPTPTPEVVEEEAAEDGDLESEDAENEAAEGDADDEAAPEDASEESDDAGSESDAEGDDLGDSADRGAEDEGGEEDDASDEPEDATPTPETEDEG